MINGSEEVLTNEAIAVNVASEQRKKVHQFEERDLRAGWGKAMQHPICAIGGRFKRLKLQGRPVLVKERVSDKIHRMSALEAAVS